MDTNKGTPREVALMRELQDLDRTLTEQGLSRADVLAQKLGYLTAAMRGLCAELHTAQEGPAPEDGEHVAILDGGDGAITVLYEYDDGDPYVTAYLRNGAWVPIDEFTPAMQQHVQDKLDARLEYVARFNGDDTILPRAA